MDANWILSFTCGMACCYFILWNLRGWLCLLGLCLLCLSAEAQSEPNTYSPLSITNNGTGTNYVAFNGGVGYAVESPEGGFLLGFGFMLAFGIGGALLRSVRFVGHRE